MKRIKGPTRRRLVTESGDLAASSSDDDDEKLQDDSVSSFLAHQDQVAHIDAGWVSEVQLQSRSLVVVSVSADNHVCLWQHCAEGGNRFWKLLPSLEIYQGDVSVVRFLRCPQSQLVSHLVIGFCDGTLETWGAAPATPCLFEWLESNWDIEKEHAFTAIRQNPTYTPAHPDTPFLATCTNQGTVNVYGLPRNKLMHVLDHEGSLVVDCAFSGTLSSPFCRCITLTADGDVIVWDTQTGELLHEQTFDVESCGDPCGLEVIPGPEFVTVLVTCRRMVLVYRCFSVWDWVVHGAIKPESFQLVQLDDVNQFSYKRSAEPFLRTDLNDGWMVCAHKLTVHVGFPAQGVTQKLIGHTEQISGMAVVEGPQDGDRLVITGDRGGTIKMWAPRRSTGSM